MLVDALGYLSGGILDVTDQTGIRIQLDISSKAFRSMFERCASHSHFLRLLPGVNLASVSLASLDCVCFLIEISYFLRCPRLEKRFIATDGRKPFLRLITLRAELSFPRRSASTVAQIRAVQYGETDVSSSPAPSQSATTWHSALMNPKFASKIAFRDTARTYTYHDIASAAYANHLKLEEDFRVEKTTKTKSKTLNGKRIGIYTPHDASFLISLWSTWLSGGIAVPLGISHPEPQLEYFLRNSDTSVILCSKETEEKATKIAKACGAEILPVTPESSDLSDAQKLRSAILPLSPSADDSALILYTSGMTGQPKGNAWIKDFTNSLFVRLNFYFDIVSGSSVTSFFS